MNVNADKQNAPEWHVCGLMVQCRPEKLGAVKAALQALSLTEVAGEDLALGRLVLAMESPDQNELLTRIEAAREIDGVIVVSLVYHEQDCPAQAL